LDGFPQAHFVSQNPVQLVVVQRHHPLQTFQLVLLVSSQYKNMPPARIVQYKTVSRQGYSSTQYSASKDVSVQNIPPAKDISWSVSSCSGKVTPTISCRILCQKKNSPVKSNRSLKSFQ
jgi:hypothetical protein